MSKHLEYMDIEDAKDRYAEVAYESHKDEEKAHCLEDALYIDVLKQIAEGHEDPQGLARIALKCNDLPYSRYYA